MNSFLCFQLEAGAGEARQGEQGVMPGPAGLGKLLLCVLFVIISQQRMPGLLSLKAAHAGDEASHSPFSRQASVTNIRSSVSLLILFSLYEIE